ncbi:MAG: hypothetical protein A3I44_02885 [Candidatus Sungbacteria bacterium RIFCSPLOWO2_02_FULL_51_17]|uniref:Uncharacterized protein n=1 Tax=Candidatus Sungbacteria bacterium RIFCSPHIGHO2_02_FULL_51_29 TaxID=1802273 RepID=A0A1G2KWR6_9BACT|nr:MAG: hypothetical protein A2676_00540 [Candidatus Sungbacteria bacterium RIFCSPHIGHO2_01_FULL_51_22]OHA03876.1 MAG: hypothetical protein A3C16_01170 [Candidatus Sungbacteria bacterium RIFCSPHIGHO2_02_FULL_51_29]OHA10840.1 MAG: hypothetical protein A3I44_02885 [Candidatus Sungbacteria bacterium RIFCSPLOWO2_02_FULL_51_17]
MAFLKGALRQFRLAGALVASSRYAAENVVKRLSRGFSYIVEYGAGDGAITKRILRGLSRDGTLVAVELNEAFLPYLHAVGDSRLKVVHGDVTSIARTLPALNLPRIDGVVSGIPFTFLEPEQREEVVSNTWKHLSCGGRFVLYQTTPLMVPVLKRHFRRVKVYYELRNLPPYFIIVAEK